MKPRSIRQTLFAAALATLSCPPAQAVELPRQLPQERLSPGGIAEIELGASALAPTVTFGGVPVLVVKDAGQWVAVVGIALSAQPGDASIDVRSGDESVGDVVD